MNAIRQLYRQPLKTLAGILLVALAVAVLCVSFSQTLAAEDTVAKLKETFISVALPANEDAAAMEWIDSVSEDSAIVQKDIHHGLASAYIPGLRQDNETTHLAHTTQRSENHGFVPGYPVYSHAMLEITVTEIAGPAVDFESTRTINFGAPDTEEERETIRVPVKCMVEQVSSQERGYGDPTGQTVYLYVNWDPASEEPLVGTRFLVESDTYQATMVVVVTEIVEDVDAFEKHYVIATDSSGPVEDLVVTDDAYVTVIGTVDRVVGLEEGYQDPTGYTVILYIRSDPDGTQQPQIPEVGQRYLVYSDSYRDLDWELRSAYVNDGDIFFWEEGVEVPYWRMESLHTITMIDSAAYFRAMSNRTETGEDVNAEDFEYEIYQVRLGDLYCGIDGLITKMFRTASLILDTDGVGDGVPAIVPLEGTAEEFLAGTGRDLWNRALQDLEINSHNYPVFAVDNLQEFGDFACGQAVITQGRAFTPEEAAGGAKVCVISKSQADANGLTVGDRIPVQFLRSAADSCDHPGIGEGRGFINPTARTFCGDCTALTEAEEFTIVGLYELASPWENVDYHYYSFTPNTVFVPIAAATGTLEYSGFGMFRSLVLDGDRLMDLQIWATEDGMEESLFLFDNGYSKLAGSMAGYREAAGKILPLGILVYVVLMALYLLLFPARQEKELSMMDSIGVPRWIRIRHVLLSTLGILIPGSVAGTVAGMLSWQYVSTALAAYMDSGVAMVLDPMRLWPVCLVQILAVFLVAAVIATVMAANTNHMNRK